MANRYLKTGENIKCQTCGKMVYVQPHQKERKKFCSKVCLYTSGIHTNTFEKGHTDLVPASSRGHSEETRKKLKAISKANAKYGKENSNWKGGHRKERKIEMSRSAYKDWRNQVFTRDNHTCQLCNTRGGYLHADHIKTWSEYPELRYDVSNGRTLCMACHYEITFNKPIPVGVMWGHINKNVKVG